MLIMTKHKKYFTPQDKTTIIFGYSLFALIVISFIVSTVIPFSHALTYPTARHFNIIVMVLVFAISAILPALISYLIGDRATHNKNKTLHHYNGVLFGVAAYWVTQLLTWVGFSSVFFVSKLAFPIPLAVSNIIPVILAIIIMAVVAVTYTKKKNTISVLQHRPYQIVLVASIVGQLVYPVLISSTTYTLGAITFLAAPIIVIGIAYKVLTKYHSTRLARLSDGIIAMSMGWIAMWVADPLFAHLQIPYPFMPIPSYVIALAVFVAYLYLRTRKRL